MTTTPTKRAYDGLDAAYEYFNKRLFNGRLPTCLITVRPHRGAYGYFSRERFGSRDGNEIPRRDRAQYQNFPAAQPVRDFIDAGARDGAPGAASFRRAIARRLPQHGMGAARGTRRPHAFEYRRAGRQAHRAADDALRHPHGPFAQAFAASEFTVPFYDRAGASDVTRAKRKVAYTRPSCDDKVWGKPDVQPHCGKCGLVAMVASYDTNTADLAT